MDLPNHVRLYKNSIRNSSKRYYIILRANANFTFNIDYVLNELVPEWDTKGNDIIPNI